VSTRCHMIVDPWSQRRMIGERTTEPKWAGWPGVHAITYVVPATDAGLIVQIQIDLSPNHHGTATGERYYCPDTSSKSTRLLLSIRSFLTISDSLQSYS
jgi:hypothetical protein